MQSETIDPSGASGIAGAAMAGIMGGLVSMFIGISLASLIFSGPLAAALPNGIGMVLISGAIVGLFAALTSSYPGIMAGVQGSTAAVLALLAAGVAAAAAPDEMVPSVLTAIGLTTLAVGILFYAMGRLRLGGLIRYVPFPVVAGFLAGTGALILRGAVEILTQGHSLNSLLESDGAVVWAAGIAMAAILVLAARTEHRLATPTALAAGPTVFHVVSALAGVSPSDAQERGWLLGPLPAGPLWDPPPILTEVDWSAIGGQLGAIASVLLVATITLLLTASAIELETQHEIDINRDLRGLGLANLAAGAAGGVPAYPHLTNTVLAARFSGPRRSGAVVAAGLNGLALVAGSRVFSVLPVAVVGGVLLFIGGSLVVEWAWETRRRLARLDFLLILAITGFIVVFGFVEGVVFGLVMAVLTFVYRYSSVDLVRTETRVAEFPSNVDRSIEDHAILREAGAGTLVLELHTFLFFGSATRLIDKILTRLADSALPPLRLLILDFDDVTGVDSSAAMSFEKLARLSKDHSFEVALTGLGAPLLRALDHLVESDPPAFRTFSDLTTGLRWAEDQLLADHTGRAVPPVSLTSALLAVVPEADNPAAVAAHFTEMNVPAGSRLIEQGDPSAGLLFLESGTVTAQLEAADSAPFRLRTMHAGTVVGEISLYGGVSSTATVIAETDCTVRHLSPNAFARLLTDDASSAAALHLFVARVLAERVAAADRSIAALRR